MARKPTFNFGHNVKPRKTGSKKPRKAGKGKTGGKSNAWRDYISNAPIPD
jgi:hypothetical protein